MYSYATSMSFVCHSYVLVCHSCVTPMCSWIICVHSYAIRMSLLRSRMSSIRHLYLIRMSLVCTRMSSVCHSYVVSPWILSYAFLRNYRLFVGFWFFFSMDWNIIFCLCALSSMERILARGLKNLSNWFSNHIFSNERLIVPWHSFVWWWKWFWNFYCKI